MAGSDTDELPRREIEARMSNGLKRALATPSAKRGDRTPSPARAKTEGFHQTS